MNIQVNAANIAAMIYTVYLCINKLIAGTAAVLLCVLVLKQKPASQGHVFRRRPQDTKLRSVGVQGRRFRLAFTHDLG